MKNKIRITKPDIQLSKRKKILLIVISAIILLGAGGYFGYMKYQEHGYAVMMERELKAKYGRHFKTEKIHASKADGITAYLTVDGEEDWLCKARCDISGSNLEDNYAAARLSHEITQKLRDRLKGEEGIYIHTDNRLEYTSSSNAGHVGTAEYLKDHPDDAFDVTVLVDKEKTDPKAIRNLLGSRAYTLTVERGTFRVFTLSESDFEEVIKKVKEYDSMNRDEIKEFLENEDAPFIELSFEEINPPKEEVKPQPQPPKEQQEKEQKDVNDTDKQ